ncbi:MAG: galactokinase [Reichenbachiella sp.]
MRNKQVIDAVKSAFLEKFNKKPLLARSPGRINLIGEHTDYNNGFVLPASIDKASYVAIQKSGSDQCSIIALDLGESYEFSIQDQLNPTDVSWANYFLGVIDQFQKRNLSVEGFEMVFSSDVPLGAGLSSSAALESSFGFALSELFKHHIDRIELSKIGQAAEHTFAGTKCGIMDQYASCLGKANHAILIDCQSLVPEYIPCALGDYHLVLFDSCVKHNLVETEYNTRREQCEEGVEILKSKYPEINSLRDANLRKLESVKDQMDLVVFNRCHYVITEYDRVMAASKALKNQKIEELGELMWQTHYGLRDDYEVSCKELDLLVELAEENPNIIGARMMGGGFGGCTINIVKNDGLEETINNILEQFENKTNQKIKHYSVSIDDGASLL